MAKKYYIWTDPTCNGVNIAWKELSGKEFFTMVKRPENKGRRFIRLGNDICPDADIIILEATEAEYIAWKREKNAGDYLRRQSKDTSITSLDVPPQESELSSLYEAVADRRIDVERAALSHLAHENLREALNSLKAEEVKFLYEIYVQGKSAVQMARERGVSQPAVTQKRDRLIKRLQKYF